MNIRDLETEYELKLFAFNGDIYVAFLRNEQVEYITNVAGLTEYLDANNDKSFFIDPPIIKTDKNPRFITDIPAIEKGITRLQIK